MSISGINTGPNFFSRIGVQLARTMNRIPMNKRALVACILTAFSVLYGLMPFDLIPDSSSRGMLDDMLVMSLLALCSAAVIKHGRTLRKLILVRSAS